MNTKSVMLFLLMIIYLHGRSSANVGSHPVLSLAEAGDQVNVTCASDGWKPKPTLTWKNRTGNVLTNSTDLYKIDNAGFTSVRSWLLVFPSDSDLDWISCSVSSSDTKTTKEGRVLPLKPASVGLSAGWRAFVILLAINLFALTVIAILSIPKIRGHIFLKGPSSEGEVEEHTLLAGENGLLPNPDNNGLSETSVSEDETEDEIPETADKETNTEEEIPDWGKMLACKVAIKPDASTTSFLEVGKSQTRITCKSVTNEADFVHVLCKERIRSGRFYWEITALTEPPSAPKIGKSYECPTSWYIGVTNESAEKNKKVPLTPENGYRVLQYDKEKGYYVHDFSLTQILVRDRFSKLGVFLDCVKNKLSFFDCDKKSHLYTFYNVDSTEPLIPVLSPGDKLQHTIMVCEEQCINHDKPYA